MKGTFNNAPMRDLSGKWHVTLTVDDSIRQIWEKYQGKELSIDIEQYREKRSIDANAYCWVLIGKIANVLRADKNDIYLEMLKRYGQGGVVKIKKEQVDLFKRTWKYHEEHEKLTEDKAQYFRFWVGSSQYNSQEFAIFIDGVISEAKHLNIEVLTPAELSAMKAGWKSEGN